MQQAIKQHLQLKNPELWSLENPYLYRVVSVLKSENQIIHQTNDDIIVSEKESAYEMEDFSIDDIQYLIDNLPDGYKMVFNLYAIEGYSHKDIGEMLGIDEGTSRSQFAKARKALQIQIDKSEGGAQA